MPPYRLLVFPSQKIAILGYGTEGKSLAHYFAAKGAHLTICDQNPNLITPEGLHTRLGATAFDNLKGFDVIFKSPGIPPARVGEIPTTSVTQYFFEHCPCPIVGVTGTKGKGTTATLIYELLKAAGYDAYLGGNIGTSPLEFLNLLKPSSWVVLELSSFQTQLLTKSPHVGVILNTTSDHLDYHANKREYHAAKAQLFNNQTPQDIAVFNADYPTCLKIVKSSHARKFAVSTKKNVKEGVQLKGKKIHLKRQGEILELMPITEVGLLGAHNLENVLPAVLVASLLDVSPKTIRKVVQRFKGLPHRLEYVTTRRGVDYYNDSFSTTPETSIAGVQAFKKPVHLIAGGSEKYSDFRGWAKACLAQKNLKTIFLTGNMSAMRMAQALEKVKPPRKSLKVVHVSKLAVAVAQARKIAKSGQVVLLSPACASFEEFANYKARGETFRELVLSPSATSPTVLC